MKHTFSRRDAAFLLLLSACMAVVAAVLLFGGPKTAAHRYLSAGESLSVAGTPMLAGGINVNTAGEKALVALPGIGEKTALEIVRERDLHGPFHFPEDLLAVKGIGEKKLQELLPHIRLDDTP